MGKSLRLSSIPVLIHPYPGILNHLTQRKQPTLTCPNFCAYDLAVSLEISPELLEIVIRNRHQVFHSHPLPLAVDVYGERVVYKGARALEAIFGEMKSGASVPTDSYQQDPSICSLEFGQRARFAKATVGRMSRCDILCSRTDSRKGCLRMSRSHGARPFAQRLRDHAHSPADCRGWIKSWRRVSDCLPP